MSQPRKKAQKSGSGVPTLAPRTRSMSADSNFDQNSSSSSPFPSVSPSPEPVSTPSEAENPTSDDSAKRTSGWDNINSSEAHLSRPPPDSDHCISAGDGLTDRLFRSKAKTPVATIFIHAGAGFHSTSNEHVHLEACSEAARLAMKFLKAGGSAVDAVEVAIKSLEDNEITNSGYGSNLTIDGVVEGDATIVDHLGRSGACGAVPMIKNPISLARLILDQSNVPLSLRRIPPNILVSNGARRFAEQHGMRAVPNEKLVSDGARARFDRWRHELYRAEIAASSMSRAATATGTPGALPFEKRARRVTPMSRMPGSIVSPGRNAPNSGTDAYNGGQPEPGQPHNSQSTRPGSAQEPSVALVVVLDEDSSARQQPSPGSSILEPSSFSDAHFEEIPGGDVGSDRPRHISVTDNAFWPPRTVTPYPKRLRVDMEDDTLQRGGSGGGSGDAPSDALSCSVNPSPIEAPLASAKSVDDTSDTISDTVGAIAVDFHGNIAAGSSSGGIGMKHSGRIGPAALVGVGTAVLPADPKDKKGTSVAAVTSGTGEHMATTLASHTCAEHLYYNMRLDAAGSPVAEYDEDTLMTTFVSEAFMSHPGVKNQVSGGAIGVMAVKKTCKGVYFYFAHNTDSFALASLSSNEKDPLVVMSRLESRESVARGGRKIRY